MNTMDKIKITLLTIITLGLIWIWINKKQKTNTELVVENKVKVNIKEIIASIGANNIEEISNTHQRVKITFKDRSIVEKEVIENMKGISGTIFTSKSVSIVVGNSAAEVARQLIKQK